MLELLVYLLGVMYSPGPVNLFALNMGMKNRFSQTLPFHIGVGSAMFFLFLLFGLSGDKLISPVHMKYIGALGIIYILYLARRLYFARVDTGASQVKRVISKSVFQMFRDGFAMQLLNPKGIIATLPVGTIYFPKLELTGTEMIISSGLLALLAVGSPASYAFLGQYIETKLSNPKYFTVFNKVLAGLLVWSAVSIGLDLTVPA